MLEHVQAHVAPTYVDPGAGLLWLPKIRRSSPKLNILVHYLRELLCLAICPCDMYFRPRKSSLSLPAEDDEDVEEEADEVVPDGVEDPLRETLSIIFNNFTRGRTFSEVVVEAKQAGYTQSDSLAKDIGVTV
ncbi:hypothetical protein ACFX2H_043830 [Malus domestica]